MPHAINHSTQQTASELPLAGVCAAVLVSQDAAGRVDIAAFERQLQFLNVRGITRYAINGATGEYTLRTSSEFSDLLACARRSCGGSDCMIAGVGAATARASRELCEIAMVEGADGILLPMPYFFPYGQDDLKEFVRAAVQGVSIPVYLYNLPSFTTRLEARTTAELIRELPQVVGIKDSSGSLETVSLLQKRVPGAGRILGNDSALHSGLAAGVCEGVVSGVSCVLPELMQRAYIEFDRDAESEVSLALKTILDEFIGWLERFPVPWGLKIIAEARGLGEATFPMPLSPEKRKLHKEFLDWFHGAAKELLCDESR